MCPGLTSQGASIAEVNNIYIKQVKVGDIVAIYVEGKQHALAVGVAVMSSAEIR